MSFAPYVANSSWFLYIFSLSFLEMFGHQPASLAYFQPNDYSGGLIPKKMCVDMQNEFFFAL